MEAGIAIPTSSTAAATRPMDQDHYAAMYLLEFLVAQYRECSGADEEDMGEGETAIARRRLAFSPAPSRCLLLLN
jgi:hypothetical protein